MAVVIGVIPCDDGGMVLEVQQSGLDITVKSGSFRVRYTDYVLAEDATFSATSDPDYAVRATGYIAQAVADDEIVLVVDEVVMDDDARPSRWDNATYRLLCPIFVVDVPAAATDLDGTTVHVRHLAKEVTP
jgi:hypothetical protein